MFFGMLSRVYPGQTVWDIQYVRRLSIKNRSFWLDSWRNHPSLRAENYQAHQQPHVIFTLLGQSYFVYATKTHAKTYTCMANYYYSWGGLLLQAKGISEKMLDLEKDLELFQS